MQPPGPQLVDAFAEVAEAARKHGVGAVRATVRYAGDAYESIVGRWRDEAWRGMVALAFEKGLGISTPIQAPRPQTEGVHHRSAGFYSREITLGAAE